MGSERTPKGTADEKGRTAMQRTGQRAGSPDKGLAMTMGTAERKRVEAVVETLSMAGSRGETLAEVAHDARNMVTALGLYCDLLEEPGVLAAPFAHYGSELRLVSAASRRLVEKMVALDAQSSTSSALPEIEEEPDNWPVGFTNDLLTARRNEHRRMEAANGWQTGAETTIGNLAAELMANRNLLAALAGPAVALTVDATGGALGVRLTGEDLTRILVNLVKNASESMDGKGRIQITLSEIAGPGGAAERLVIAIEDNGPGIGEKSLEKIFESGFTTHGRATTTDGWPSTHRGLGLAISRSIVEAAGGRIFAANHRQKGARLEIDLPVHGASR